MTVSLYQTGVSGLLAAQQQLAVTGNNIANVNTEGYTRQRTEQNAAIGIATGQGYIGAGTYVQDVTRIYDQFAYKEQITSQSNLGKAESLNSSLDQLNEIMSFSNSAMMNSLDRFYQSVNGIADNPNDLGLRNIALNQASILSSDFNSLNNNFDQIEKSVNGEIEQITSRMSEISIEIAKINEAIVQSQNSAQTGQPNSLLDRRDQLVNDLSKYTKVTTVKDQNGVMTVMIGNGNTLVAGITPLTINVDAGDPDPNQIQLRLSSRNSSVALNGQTLGGAIQANFEYRDETIAQVRSEMNQLAMAISATLNNAQANGLDLNATQGQNIFTDINTEAAQASRVLSPSSNSGSLSAKVNITDVSLVPSNEFEVRYDGTNYILTDRRNNSVTNLGAAGAGTYSTAYGFEFIETSGTPSTDDSFIIRPTENSAASMSVVLTDGAGIAASSSVEVTPSDNNINSGKVNIVDMFDPVAARTVMPIRIDILESPVGSFNYTITDNTGTTSAPIAYTPPSQKINLPASPATALFAIEITGEPSGLAPNAPEQFFIDDAFGEGNSNNAVFMALSQEKNIVDGGKKTFSQSLSSSTAKIGSKASSAELVANTAEALFTQAFNRNQSTSGVNLDEEAANLLKFQQAYQAASQIISVANTIFDTLLAAAR